MYSRLGQVQAQQWQRVANCYQYNIIVSLSTMCRNTCTFYLLFYFNRKSFIWLDLGFTCVSFVTGALAFWAPKFLLYASKAQGISHATESG